MSMADGLKIMQLKYQPRWTNQWTTVDVKMENVIFKKISGRFIIRKWDIYGKKKSIYGHWKNKWCSDAILVFISLNAEQWLFHARRRLMGVGFYLAAASSIIPAPFYKYEKQFNLL